jgi:hypothetical protein
MREQQAPPCIVSGVSISFPWHEQDARTAHLFAGTKGDSRALHPRPDLDCSIPVPGDICRPISAPSDCSDVTSLPDLEIEKRDMPKSRPTSRGANAEGASLPKESDSGLEIIHRRLGADYMVQDALFIIAIDCKMQGFDLFQQRRFDVTLIDKMKKPFCGLEGIEGTDLCGHSQPGGRIPEMNLAEATGTVLFSPLPSAQNIPGVRSSIEKAKGQ